MAKTFTDVDGLRETEFCGPKKSRALLGIPFQFSLRICLICGILAGGMLRLSYWQWERYKAKLDYIATLEARFAESPTSFQELALKDIEQSWEGLVHRRFELQGIYDFQHEVVLRNRRFNELAGVHLLTPLKIESTSGKAYYVLVNRGFIPLSRSTRDKRKMFQKEAKVSFTGLLKEPANRRIFAPKDPPTGPGLPWVDAWLRVDVANIQKQLPYPLLPIYFEIADGVNESEVGSKFIDTKDGRDELMFMPGAGSTSVKRISEETSLETPIPIFSTVIPPGRHLGYVFEWAAMALACILIGLGLQIRAGVGKKDS